MGTFIELEALLGIARSLALPFILFGSYFCEFSLKFSSDVELQISRAA